MQDLFEIYQNFQKIESDIHQQSHILQELMWSPDPKTRRQGLHLLLSFGEEALFFLVETFKELPKEFCIHERWNTPEIELEILDLLSNTKRWGSCLENGFFDTWLCSLLRYDVHHRYNMEPQCWPSEALTRRVLSLATAMTALPRAEFSVDENTKDMRHTYSSQDKQSQMGTFLVSQLLWKEHMGFVRDPHPNPLHPVQNVSFFDALIFCNRLSQHQHQKTCYVLNDVLVESADNCTERDEFWVAHRKDFNFLYYEGPTGFRIPFDFEWEFAAKANFGYYDVDKHQQISINALGIHDLMHTKKQWVWSSRSEDSEEVGYLRGGNDPSKQEYISPFYSMASLRVASSRYI